MPNELSEAEVKLNEAKIDKILEKYEREAGGVIPILQEVQETCGYLPEGILTYVSERSRVPLSKIYGIVTFYAQFSLVPRGRNTIKICLGTACHVRGAVRILEKIERSLGIKPGQTTKDLMFTLETVNCLGACALGPLMVVDGEYFGEMNSAKVDKILRTYKKE